MWVAIQPAALDELLDSNALTIARCSSWLFSQAVELDLSCWKAIVRYRVAWDQSRANRAVTRSPAPLTSIS